jgi:O-succinylbenzoic acid--CoA ligase
MSEPLPLGPVPWLAARARRDPAGEAVVAGDLRLDWAGLAARVARLAGGLAALGLRPGDRVAVVMEPSVRLVELVHAAQYAGLGLVLLHPRLAGAEIAALVRHAEPALVVHDDAHAALVSADRPRGDSAPASRAIAVPAPRVMAAPALDELPPVAVPPVAVEAAAVQTILYTSGTTGRPKGVVSTHANHHASAVASRRHLGARPGDRWLSVLPLCHVGGLSIVMRSVLDGTPLVLHARFDPAAVWRTLAAERITLLSLVPTMLHRLLDAAPGDSVAPALRCVLVGGAALAPALAARARAAGLPVAPTYGLTEAASQVATAPPGADDAAGVGRPLSGTRVRIADPDAEGRGEILVAGPTVMAGYFRDPAATAAALRDGWLHTGDVGRLDAAGRLTVLDRRTDLVVTGGENVHPAEVEGVLLAHPAIAEAAVYGVADPEWGKRVQAAVVLRPGADFDEAALRAWCRARLAGFKVPRAIAAVAELPRTASGKLRRHALAAGS